MKSFLLELGVGFAFLGSQYRLEVGGEEFFVDLLFYHVRLHCYVVLELKVTHFKPEYAGQLSFYVTAVNRLLKQEADAPTIGILLCKTKNNVVVEYALEQSSAPIGVSTYQLEGALPQELEGVLPTVAQLEAELEKLEAPGRIRMRIKTLEIRNFKAFWGTHTISLTQENSETCKNLLVLGENGSGQTSLVKAIDGALSASRWGGRFEKNVFA